jgi:hypothetical protein
MKQVMDGRKEQVQEAIELNKQQQEEVLLHKAQLERQIQESKELERTEQQQRLHIRKEYSQVLADQIKDIEKRKELEREALEQENLHQKVFFYLLRWNTNERIKCCTMV